MQGRPTSRISDPEHRIHRTQYWNRRQSAV